MNPFIRLAARVALRLSALVLIYMGVAEVHVAEFTQDPEVLALVTLAISETFFAIDKAWGRIKERWQ
jgi:hypothetical protein